MTHVVHVHVCAVAVSGDDDDACDVLATHAWPCTVYLVVIPCHTRHTHILHILTTVVCVCVCVCLCSTCDPRVCVCCVLLLHIMILTTFSHTHTHTRTTPHTTAYARNTRHAHTGRARALVLEEC